MNAKLIRPLLPSFLLSLMLSPLAPVAHAQSSPTLKKIADTGVISLGHRESSIPFSYYDDKQQVVGYSHEMMLKAVDAIKAELKKPGIAIKLVPVTSQNRIPLVLNGSVDIECGSTTNNSERARQVDFSTNIVVVGTDGGPRVQLMVDDSGAGLTPELQERLFAPFFTTKPHGHGLGLGLAISRDIIRSFQGELRAENVAQGGARFTVELPERHPHDPSAPPDPQPATQP
ncbi:MAG: transporter substrate-binding domain-containing protein [Gammaproteobacteria bacterium]|nr:transporter substrate-binding domain-containing protein [Gammaproteobacteria bacterium]